MYGFSRLKGLAKGWYVFGTCAVGLHGEKRRGPHGGAATISTERSTHAGSHSWTDCEGNAARRRLFRLLIRLFVSPPVMRREIQDEIYIVGLCFQDMSSGTRTFCEQAC